MNILLINTNPVVSRLVSLCMRDESISFEEVDRISEVSGMHYDIVFVDDASYHDEVAAFLGAIDIEKIVFLSGRDAGEEIGSYFETVIKKPFLPSQIQAVLDSMVAEKKMEKQERESIASIEKDPSIFPLAASDEAEKEKEMPAETNKSGEEDVSEKEDGESSVEELQPPKVLDPGEVEQIKALLGEEENEMLPALDLEDEEKVKARKVEVITKKLEEEGLEIVQEEEIIGALSRKPKKKKEKSKKRKKKKQKKEEEVYTFEEALLAAVENMKPKKIKQLLKGAEVTISIRFKDDI